MDYYLTNGVGQLCIWAGVGEGVGAGVGAGAGGEAEVANSITFVDQSIHSAN